MRPKIFTTLVVAAVALAACLFAAGAHAQRDGASRQADDNAARGGKPKRVFVGRGSDTPKGSRVTITADDSLKDYSAYRSGDRFYVVLPKSAAGARGGGGGGKGYSDMQVQQRGDSVVLSYRVQPGAKPRVEQKFNRLDVVFDVPEGGQQSAAAPAQPDAGRATQPAQAANRNPATAGQPAQAATPQTAPGAAERRPTPAEALRPQAAETAPAGAGQPPLMVAPPPADPAQGLEAAPSSTAEQPQETATPAASPSDGPQIAQAQAPGAVEPITAAQPAPNTQAAGTSLGTFLLRNWALALVFALVVVGLGLVIAARRTSARPRTEGDASEGMGTPVLDEPRAMPLVTSKATPPVTSTPAPSATARATATPAATAAPSAAELDAVGEPSLGAGTIAAAAALAGGAAAASKSRKQSRKEARQEARRKKKGGPAPSGDHVDETAVAGAPAQPVADEAVAESVYEETAAAPAVEETAASVETMTPAVEVSDLKESVAEAPAAEVSAAEAVEVSRAEEALDAAVMEPVAPSAAEVASRPSELAERSEVEEAELTRAVVAAPEAVEAAPAETETVEIAPAEPEAFVEPEPAVEREAVEAATAEVVAVEAVKAEAEEATVESAAPVTEIVPAVAPDHETVQAETRRLLEGEEYSRAVVGTRDPVARQMIAAELLYVLAGRNEEKRRRAGAAFVEQGYYDEVARDLRAADAPAERAAAARSLALLGDRKATPLLVAALEDTSSEVRRAAVEALGALRDPAAVAPLESLLERERNERNRIPGRVILNAVQSCREGSAEVASEAPAAAAPAVETREAVRDVETREAVKAVEPAPFVPGEEDVAPAAALIEERGVEPLSSEAAREEEETLVVSRAEPSPAAESRSQEPAAAEPKSVVETGIRPRVEDEEDADETTREVAAVSAEEVGLEPFAQPEEEEAAPPLRESVPAHAESAQPALFDSEAAPAAPVAESTRDIVPVAAVASDVSKPSADEVFTGEWFDLDVNEFRGAGQPAAAEPRAAQPAADAAVFESSSGGTIGTPSAAEPASFVLEPEPPAARDAETGRELDLAEPREAVTAPLKTPAETRESSRAYAPESAEKGISPLDEFSAVPAAIQHRLASDEPSERAAAVVELSHVDTDEAFQHICAAFDDRAEEVRSAAARALYELRPERADSFTRALREATPERRREIGASISASGLAGEAISQLTGESREKTYEAFSLLFLMAKAGEVQPLVRAIESHPSNEVRLAVVKLLALSGQKEILPAFRRLAVRGSLPTEVRSAVMEAIYQISSNQPTHA